MPPHEELVWKCHVCHRERPDERISVYSTKKHLGQGIEMTQNVRYCNDNPSCIEGAKDVDFGVGKEKRP